MYWILAALLLLLALTVPRLRLVGIAGCIILAGLLLWGVVQQRGEQQSTEAPVRDRGAPVSPAATRVPIPPAEIVLSEPALTGGGAPFEFSGKIRNESTDIRLRTVTIRIVRKDCYEGALDPSGCVTLWQDRHWLRISVPPQESRSFAVPTWPRSAVPRGRGTVEDDFEVLSASGEPVQR